MSLDCRLFPDRTITLATSTTTRTVTARREPAPLRATRTEATSTRSARHAPRSSQRLVRIKTNRDPHRMTSTCTTPWPLNSEQNSAAKTTSRYYYLLKTTTRCTGQQHTQTLPKLEQFRYLLKKKVSFDGHTFK